MVSVRTRSDLSLVASEVFPFEVDRLFSKDHEWVAVSDSDAGTVGISEHAQVTSIIALAIYKLGRISCRTLLVCIGYQYTA